MKESVDLPGELHDDPRESRSKWVDINIPWNMTFDESAPEVIALDEANREFYAWLTTESERVFGKDIEPFPVTSSVIDIGDLIEACEERAPELREYASYPDPVWFSSILEKYAGDGQVIKLAQRRHRNGRMRVWYDSDSSVREREAVIKPLKQKVLARGFINHPLNKPGVLVEVEVPLQTEPGKARRRFLIGGCMQGGGYYEDASMDKDVFVLRALDLTQIPLLADLFGKG